MKFICLESVAYSYKVSPRFRQVDGTDIVALETVECRQVPIATSWFTVSPLFNMFINTTSNTTKPAAAETTTVVELPSLLDVRCDHQTVEYIEDANRGGYGQTPVLLSDNVALIAAIVISVLLAAGCGIGAAVAVVLLTRSLRAEFRRYVPSWR